MCTSRNHRTVDGCSALNTPDVAVHSICAPHVGLIDVRWTFLWSMFRSCRDVELSLHHTSLTSIMNGETMIFFPGYLPLRTHKNSGWLYVFFFRANDSERSPGVSQDTPMSITITSLALVRIRSGFLNMPLSSLMCGSSSTF